MNHLPKEYSQTHEVVYYECDKNGNMTVSSMISCAIQVSEQQSDQLNRGSEFINQLGVTWILTNYYLEITKLPKVGQKIELVTKAEEYNKYFCYRTFWLQTSSGEELVKISAVFALMNLETRKMSSVTEEIIAPFESEKIKKIKRFGKLEKIESGKSTPYRVRFYDIDSNQHVNNAIYFDWIMDVLGYDFLTKHTPKTITIRYDKEVEYGATVHSIYELVATEENKATRHEIKLGNQLCCEAYITWDEM